MNTMMTKTSKTTLARYAATAFLALILVSATTLAGTAGRYLHISVQETGRYGENVAINVPLQMVEALLPMIQTDEMRNGRIRIDHHMDLDEFHGVDLRGVVEALRDAPDTDFVTVRSDDENVRVRKEDGFIKIDVDDRHDERVRVVIPMTVVDALIGDDPYELDLMAAINALADYEGGDLVTVESDNERVRIWIDDNEGQD